MCNQSKFHAAGDPAYCYSQLLLKASWRLLASPLLPYVWENFNTSSTRLWQVQVGRLASAGFPLLVLQYFNEPLVLQPECLCIIFKSSLWQNIHVYIKPFPPAPQ
jgi:hypothetical protein